MRLTLLLQTHNDFPIPHGTMIQQDCFLHALPFPTSTSLQRCVIMEDIYEHLDDNTDVKFIKRIE
jgi:hypothetical protein